MLASTAKIKKIGQLAKTLKKDQFIHYRNRKINLLDAITTVEGLNVLILVKLIKKYIIMILQVYILMSVECYYHMENQFGLKNKIY